MDEFLGTNRALWDGWAGIHHASVFYDVAGFRRGKSSLKSVELEAVGNVAGQELLHLQCHFGLDTLSWARLGARVTGVDFSEKAISLAKGLAAELSIPADFQCLEVTQLPEEWTDRFHVVFTSYGVLPWLPSLRSWATTIARVLRPGGSFHLVEFHPFSAMLDDDGHIRHGYFPSDSPEASETHGSYADRTAPFSHRSYEWPHSFSELFTSVGSAGLSIRDFREYPYAPDGAAPYLEESSPGRWTIRGSPVAFPLLFSIHAVKPMRGGDGG